jgi:ribosomal protein S12 methylthiotransferase
MKGEKHLSYQVAFISLGCAKNQVNCEQMMASVQAAGHTIGIAPEGADVVVINTCGFLQSAAEEAIDHILQIAALKQAGSVKKILVTGCMAQRYKEQILSELPEVDGVLGTGSYGSIVEAIEDVMAGERPARFDSIHSCEQAGERILTTPAWYAYLRIAEGCDNHCAYCVIPSLRGKYRSRPLDSLLSEAKELSDAGVKECIVIAQDITRYGTDFDGRHHLTELLHELCKLDFQWIRLHYLYPDEITDDLIDTIAQEPKVLPYLDIPIQHCNDMILKKMNRRDTKADLLALFGKLRARIPGLVLRTSLITGLPYEDDAAFEELCAFLREVKIERAGVFPFSPEDGTPAAAMEHVSMEEALRRKELAEDVQSDIIDAYNDACLGQLREVLCEGFDGQSQMYVGRSYAESPGIDGNIYFSSEEEVQPGSFVSVRLTDVMDGELVGVRAE